MVERTASCVCGQLRIICEGDPERITICACTACQRRTGSAYGVGAYFDQTRIKAVAGESKSYSRTSEAGRWLNLSFCPACGTTVFWELELLPGKVGVAVGAFADPAFPKSHSVVWAQHKDGFPCQMI